MVSGEQLEVAELAVGAYAGVSLRTALHPPVPLTLNFETCGRHVELRLIPIITDSDMMV
jgi:hypothetical protein